MASITYDELERRVSLDTQAITKLCNRFVKVPVSYVAASFVVLMVSYKTLRIAWSIRDIEQHCATCERADCSIKDDLQKVVTTLNRCVNSCIRIKMPSMFYSPIRYSSDFIDNKVENLTIASDKQLREMVSQLADKMNR
jgi:hypothetical protein